MTTQKHTPGPWVHNGARAVYRGQHLIATSHGDPSGWYGLQPVPKIDERDANAALIAAAPELLEALKAMAEHFGPLEGNQFFNDEVNRAFELTRKALAKAEGKQS